MKLPYEIAILNIIYNLKYQNGDYFILLRFIPYICG